MSPGSWLDRVRGGAGGVSWAVPALGVLGMRWQDGGPGGAGVTDEQAGLARRLREEDLARRGPGGDAAAANVARRNQEAEDAAVTPGPGVEGVWQLGAAVRRWRETGTLDLRPGGRRGELDDWLDGVAAGQVSPAPWIRAALGVLGIRWRSQGPVRIAGSARPGPGTSGTGPHGLAGAVRPDPAGQLRQEDQARGGDGEPVVSGGSQDPGGAGPGAPGDAAEAEAGAARLLAQVQAAGRAHAAVLAGPGGRAAAAAPGPAAEAPGEPERAGELAVAVAVAQAAVAAWIEAERDGESDGEASWADRYRAESGEVPVGSAAWRRANRWWSPESGELTLKGQEYCPSAQQIYFLDSDGLVLGWVGADGDTVFDAMIAVAGQGVIRDRITAAAGRAGIGAPAGAGDEAGWLLRRAAEAAGDVPGRVPGPGEAVTGRHLRVFLAYLVEHLAGDGGARFDRWERASWFPADGGLPGADGGEEFTRQDLIAELRAGPDADLVSGGSFAAAAVYFLSLPVRVLGEGGFEGFPRADGAAGGPADPVVVEIGDRYLAALPRGSGPGPAGRAGEVPAAARRRRRGGIWPGAVPVAGPAVSRPGRARARLLAAGRTPARRPAVPGRRPHRGTGGSWSPMSWHQRSADGSGTRPAALAPIDAALEAGAAQPGTPGAVQGVLDAIAAVPDPPGGRPGELIGQLRAAMEQERGAFARRVPTSQPWWQEITDNWHQRSADDSGTRPAALAPIDAALEAAAAQPGTPGAVQGVLNAITAVLGQPVEPELGYQIGKLRGVMERHLPGAGPAAGGDPAPPAPAREISWNSPAAPPPAPAAADPAPRPGETGHLTAGFPDGAADVAGDEVVAGLGLRVVPARDRAALPGAGPAAGGGADTGRPAAVPGRRPHRCSGGGRSPMAGTRGWPGTTRLRCCESMLPSRQRRNGRAPPARCWTCSTR